jgi:hypothetical protein
MNSLRCYSVSPLAILLAGCAGADRSPTIEFSGSYFPAWMICIVCGLVLTSLARLLLIRLKLDSHLWPAPLVYFCLIAIFTILVWLLLFNR